MISDSGEVRSVDLNPTTSVRIAERDLNTEVSKYLGLVASISRGTCKPLEDS